MYKYFVVPDWLWLYLTCILILFFIQLVNMRYICSRIFPQSSNVGYASPNLWLSYYILPESLGHVILFQSYLHQIFIKSLKSYAKSQGFTVSISVHNPLNVPGNHYWDIHAYITVTNFTTKNRSFSGSLTAKDWS